MIEVSLPQVLDLAMKRHAEDVYTSLPGIVDSFNPVTMTVNVKLAVRLVRRDQKGDPEYVDAPLIPDVAVLYPRSGGFTMTFPLQKGDSVLLVFTTLDAGNWELTGQPLEPPNPIRGGLSSCVAIPGWFPVTSLPNPDLPQIAARGSKAMFGQESIAGAQLHVGDGTVDAIRGTQLSFFDPKYVAIASLVKAELDVIRNLFNSHTHPETGTTTSQVTAPQQIPAIGDIAATVLRSH